MKLDKYYIFCVNIKNSQKSLQQFDKANITMEESIVIRDPETFRFDFDWPKHVDENFKHETEFIIKSNESLAENKIKNEIEQLLLKYKNGNNIHEHGKTVKRVNYVNLFLTCHED